MTEHTPHDPSDNPYREILGEDARLAADALGPRNEVEDLIAQVNPEPVSTGDSEVGSSSPETQEPEGSTPQTPFQKYLAALIELRDAYHASHPSSYIPPKSTGTRGGNSPKGSPAVIAGDNEDSPASETPEPNNVRSADESLTFEKVTLVLETWPNKDLEKVIGRAAAILVERSTED